jgi:hypothetical protein
MSKTGMVIADYKLEKGMLAAQSRVVLLLRTLRLRNQVPLRIPVRASAVTVSHLALLLATSNVQLGKTTVSFVGESHFRRASCSQNSKINSIFDDRLGRRILAVKALFQFNISKGGVADIDIVEVFHIH